METQRDLLDLPLQDDTAVDVVFIFPTAATQTPASRIALASRIQTFLTDHLAEIAYSWHRGVPPQWRLRHNRSLGGFYLHGLTICGECSDDADMILGLVCLVTKAFEGVYARVLDTMGDPVLVTAAGANVNATSSGAEASIMESEIVPNQGWIANGTYCVLQFAEKDPDGWLPIATAYEYLAEERRVRIDHKVTKAGLKRAWTLGAGYIEDTQQWANVILPRSVAAVMIQRPALVSQCLLNIMEDEVRKEPEFVKSLGEPKFLDKANDLVTHSIKFSKTTFALVLLQTPALKFYAAQYFPGMATETDEISKAAVLGTAITLGLEMELRKAAEHTVLGTATDVPSSEYISKHLDDAMLIQRVKGPGPREQIEKYLATRYEPSDRVDLATSLVGSEVSDEVIKKLRHVEDDDSWFQKMLETTQEEIGQDEEEWKAEMPGLVKDLENQMKLNSWHSDGMDDVDQDEESDDGIDLPEGMDEDDFFEFFLKDALKMSPEEIEQYRADGDGANGIKRKFSEAMT